MGLSNENSNNDQTVSSSKEVASVIGFYKKANQQRSNVSKQVEEIRPLIVEDEIKQNVLFEEVKKEDPLAKFFTKFAENLETIKVQKEQFEKTKEIKSKQIKTAAEQFADKLKEVLVFQQPKKDPSIPVVVHEKEEQEKKEDLILEETKEKLLEEEQVQKELPEKTIKSNIYVEQLKAAEKTTKVPEKLKKITDVKQFISSSNNRTI